MRNAGRVGAWTKRWQAEELVCQLAVFAGQTWQADAGEVTLAGDGSCRDAGAARQARVVEARVWQEAVDVDLGVAALAGQDVAQLTLVLRAHPIVVVVLHISRVYHWWHIKWTWSAEAWHAETTVKASGSHW